MASGNFFAGSFSRRPRVVAQIDDSGLTPFQIGAPEIVAILGEGLGGEPLEPTLYNSPTDAAAVVRGGELLTAIRYCFDPSTASRGASMVYAVRVNDAAAATLTLKDDNSGDTVRLDSLNWGLEDNLITAKVETGTLKGKKLSVAKGRALYVKDNIARNSFSLAYVGDAATATVTIDGDSLAVTTAGSVDDVTVDFNVYKTVEAVVSYLNSTGKYVAVVMDTNPQRLMLNTQDFVTAEDIAVPDHQTYSLVVGAATIDIVVEGWAQDWTIQVVSGAPTHNVAMTAVKTAHAILVTLGTDNSGVVDATKNTATLIEAAIEAINGLSSSITGSGAEVRSTILGVTPFVSGDLNAVTMTGNLQAFVDFVNGSQQPLVSATRLSTGLVPANIAATHLASGDEGSTSAQDWQDALDALQSLDIAHVVVLSDDPAVHALADEHCQQMSADGRRPRRAWVGAALSESQQDYIDRAEALNSSRTILAVQGIGGFDDNGIATTHPPYIAAALLAGLQAGVAEIGDSITHQSVRVTGLEWLPTDADEEILIEAGAILMEQAQNRGFFRVVRGITTWLQSDAFNRVEISTGIALDQVVRNVIDGLDIFIGQKGSPVLVHRVASRTESILMGEQAAGVIVGDAASPAFRNIEVKLREDVVSVSFECSPGIPVNFINVVVHANAFTGETSIAVG